MTLMMRVRRYREDRASSLSTTCAISRQSRWPTTSQKFVCSTRIPHVLGVTTITKVDFVEGMDFITPNMKYFMTDVMYSMHILHSFMTVVIHFF